MNKFQTVFADGYTKVPFLTCGDPDLAATAAKARAAVEAGAKMLVLAIPFSDPTAESPARQAASVRALRSGTTTAGIFEMVRELRQDVKVPLVFSTYANVVFSYKAEEGKEGAAGFIAACRAAGIDGLFVTDLPYEEKEEFQDFCQQQGIALLSAVAPASETRIAMIAQEATGFLLVTAAGGEALRRTLAAAQAASDLPCLVDGSIAGAEDLASGVLVDQ